MECGICLHPYESNNSKKHPFILECGHSFCKGCLRKLLFTNPVYPVCPLDRSKISKKFEEFKTNYSLLDIISKNQAAQRNCLSRSKISEKISRLTHSLKSNSNDNGFFPGKLVNNMPKITNRKVLLILEKYGNFLEKIEDIENPNSPFQVYQLDDGSAYFGQMKQGMREGLGRQIWPDGSVYEGIWRNDMANIYGRLIHSDGDFYQGSWKNNKVNGKGKFQSEDGEIYDGEWLNDTQHGYGVETWPNKVKYEGCYKEGKRNGQGKFYWSDGSTYEGDFLNNDIDGVGKYSWTNVGILVCQWKMNKCQGEGRVNYDDGKSYEGQYLNGKKNGFGIYEFPDGKMYKGYWKDGKKHGIGLHKSKNGKEILGEWFEDKLIRWFV